MFYESNDCGLERVSSHKSREKWSDSRFKLLIGFAHMCVWLVRGGKE